MYVCSTIRPSAFIGDNQLGSMGCAECVSLNQCLGLFGRHVIIKKHIKEQIDALIYSESVLITTSSNIPGSRYNNAVRLCV